jgi:hypothetical protein
MRYDPIVKDTIKQLKQRLAQVEATLAVLEDELLQSRRKRSTRGRKSMGAEERLEVSARIKRYWRERQKRVQEATA